MSYIAIVLAVFLFYKFVERKHKIVFFKILGIVCLVAGVLGGGAFLYNSLNTKIKKHEKPDVEITYSYHFSKAPDSMKKEISLQETNKFFEEYRFTFSKIPKNMLGYVQWTLAGSRLDREDPYKSFIDKKKEEDDAFFERWSDDETKKEQAIKKFESLVNERYTRYLSKPFPLSDDDPLYSYVHDARIDSLPEELQGRYLENAITNKIRKEIERIRELKSEFKKRYLKALNKRSQESEISVKVCNNKDTALNSYDFNISGLEEGRSTRHSLTKDSYLESTRFQGDIIIGPKSCETMNWSGHYLLFDKYEISTVFGRWAESN